MVNNEVSCCCSREKKTDHVVPAVSSKLTRSDIRTRRKLRWGFGRDSSRIAPGLYKLGNPTKASPVMVSANYIMSFDYLRSSLGGIDSWIVVLDTKGINVWCAAGKGTFGTAELISRIRILGLENLVSHRELILPQLGAPGIQAHEVGRETGFKVIYGPIRARDIPDFLKNGKKATEQMRSVTFSFRDRAVLTPVELVQSWKLLVGIIPYAFLFHFLHNARLTPAFGYELALYVGSVILGSVAAPLLLPWIPGRSLALKGWFLGILFAVAAGIPMIDQPAALATFALLLPPIPSFLTLNFTGSTPYTSLSGVKKEMKIALPLIILSAAAGTLLNILRIFVPGIL